MKNAPEFHLFRMYDYDAAKAFPKFPSIVQEKHDGVRAIYDFENGGFWLRTGRFIELYPGFLDTARNLDGELVADTFDAANALVRRKEVDPEAWLKYLKFVVFDVADPELASKKYSERLEIAQAEAARNAHFCLPIENMGIARSVPEILGFRDIVLARGGEGVMSRFVDEKYITESRRHGDFKFKRENVVDAVVTGYVTSRTKRFKYSSLLVSVPEFGLEDQSVGSGLNDFERRSLRNISGAYPIGSTLRVKFMERTKNGKLRMPRIVRETE